MAQNAQRRSKSQEETRSATTCPAIFYCLACGQKAIGYVGDGQLLWRDAWWYRPISTVHRHRLCRKRCRRKVMCVPASSFGPTQEPFPVLCAYSRGRVGGASYTPSRYPRARCLILASSGTSLFTSPLTQRCIAGLSIADSLLWRRQVPGVHTRTFRVRVLNKDKKIGPRPLPQVRRETATDG